MAVFLPIKVEPTIKNGYASLTPCLPPTAYEHTIPHTKRLFHVFKVTRSRDHMQQPQSLPKSIFSSLRYTVVQCIQIVLYESNPHIHLSISLSLLTHLPNDSNIVT